MERYLLPIVVERDDDGYFVSCPGLQGCCSQGDTYEEAVSNIRDAITLHIQDRLECGETVEPPSMVSVATLEVAA
jgi:predicted RNase H-like HicB family nuclease